MTYMSSYEELQLEFRNICVHRLARPAPTEVYEIYELLLFHYYVILPYKVKRRREIRGRNTL